MKSFSISIVIVLLLGFIGLAGYLMYSPVDGFIFDVNRAVSRLSSITEFDESETIIDSSEILALFRSISSIQLDDSGLRHVSFARLVDIAVPIVVDVTPGRSNPFLPIGIGEAPSVTTPVSEQITSPAPSDPSSSNSAGSSDINAIFGL